MTCKHDITSPIIGGLGVKQWCPRCGALQFQDGDWITPLLAIQEAA